MYVLNLNIKDAIVKTYRELTLQRTYTTLDTNIMRDVVDEILKTTVEYSRGVGFFSSSWLKEVAEGLSYFIVNGGRAKILTSIKLSESDWNAIKKAADIDSEIEALIDRTVLETTASMKKAMEENTLAILSFLIKEGYIEFKFAVPCGSLEGGMFHSKTSIFTDINGDTIVIAGSQNDSHQASINEETVNLFTSWGEGRLYAADHIKQFSDKWHGKHSNLKIYSLSETAKRNIIETGACYTDRLVKIRENISKKIKSGEKRTLRPYQEQAVEAWFDNNCKGFFEMATGTGKTFTAIAAVNRLKKQNSRICFIVLVPYKHLASQWIKDLKENGYNPIPCYENKHNWISILNSKINQYKTKQIESLCVVALYATASNNEFQLIIRNSLNKVRWLLIADEAHNAGSQNTKKTLFESSTYRIGLSATPIRWYDEEGSNLIRSYFGKTVIDYPLEKAIQNKFLTPYEYHPIPVELTEYELTEYSILSDRIARLMQKNPKTVDEEEKLQKLLIKRADLVAKAENKIKTLIELVKQHKRELEEQGKLFRHNLFYVAKGECPIVLEALSKAGLKVHEFIGTIPNKERPAILKSFADGDIDGIVAIRCLDEGVDVPATKRAYIMSSTTNPKEFIQRRGRILRLHDDKNRAYIYDFMVGPWITENCPDTKIAVSLLNRELPRFAEFNNCSENRSSARNVISKVCEYYGIIDELDIRPYELYTRNKELQEEAKISQPVGDDE